MRHSDVIPLWMNGKILMEKWREQLTLPFFPFFVCQMNESGVKSRWDVHLKWGWLEGGSICGGRQHKEQFISENEKSKKSAQTSQCESYDTRNSRTQAATRARLGDSLSDFIKLPQHSHNRKLYFRVRRRAVVGLEKMKSWHKLKTFLSPPSWVLNAVRMVHTNEMRGEKCSPVDFQRSTFSSFTAATCFLHNKSFIQFKSSCRTFFKAP